ncbi:MFS transporter [Pelagibius litoralis]|uniref:MFS transporter n=1 Tax=Pelagibius litoralis TaxID=374515 RepID=UPI001F0DA58B|nr:MFS transporter [Pelagibius litoralis]
MSGERRRLGIFSWCLYDWANSAFSTVIVTFVFATYFTQAVAPDPITGTIFWARALSLAALVVAVLSPALGAIADKCGRRKPWLLCCTLACVVATSLMWFVEPTTDDMMPALILVFLASVAFSLAMVFYDAMLPTLVSSQWRGRVSGWGWGLGYFGGLVCLLLVLLLARGGALSSVLDAGSMQQHRLAAIVAGLWFAIFSVPLFLLTPDRPATEMSFVRAATDGLKTLWGTLQAARRHAAILRFLIAHLFYTNGLTTLFAFGAIYAAGTFGMDFGEVLRFGIALNISAGCGALAFAWIDDRIGSKRTILIALSGLILLGGILVVVQSKQFLWTFGVMLGIFVGPAQAAGRSLMARLTPRDRETEMFGLYALAGKATVFLGPLVFSLATDLFDSQRAGMATILIFFILGFVVLRGLHEPER